MTRRLLPLLGISLLLLTGCNLIYKQNIQQGNALEQDDLDELELGMSKNQVAFLLGTPAIQDPFHQDRWDYLSSFARRGGDPVRRLVTLKFENDSLVYMRGVQPGETEEVLTESGAQAMTAAVPITGVNVENAEDYEDLEILADGTSDWRLQFGSFSDRAAADRALAELAADGIDATIFGQIIRDTGFFILRAGSYDSREEALQALEEIQSRTGRRPFVVTPGS
jgi:outer membrane protein assembly factor BamE